MLAIAELQNQPHQVTIMEHKNSVQMQCLDGYRLLGHYYGPNNAFICSTAAKE